MMSCFVLATCTSPSFAGPIRSFVSTDAPAGYAGMRPSVAGSRARVSGSYSGRSGQPSPSRGGFNSGNAVKPTVSSFAPAGRRRMVEGAGGVDSNAARPIARMRSISAPSRRARARLSACGGSPAPETATR